MTVGDIVELRAVAGAVNRTKNRIRENGPHFVVRSESQTCQFDRHGQLWVRLESIAQRASDGKGGKETWSGWLPVKEIVTDTLTDEQLEKVCGGMSWSKFNEWRCGVLNERR